MENLLSELENISTDDLKIIASKFSIQYKSRKDLIQNIYDRYCDVKKYVSYTYIRQLGREGKDGRTFLAIDSQSREIAIKIFRKNKSTKSIEREASLQIIASEYGISPIVYDYSGKGKYIAMEKLDKNLYDCFCEQNGQLTIKQQKSLISLFKKLDECGVFHLDPNPLNFMKKDGKWYVIDFGFSKPINAKNQARYGKNPNIKYMPLGLKLKLCKIYKHCRLEYFDNYI
jgi:serine/threonine protein kinase